MDRSGSATARLPSFPCVAYPASPSQTQNLMLEKHFRVLDSMDEIQMAPLQRKTSASWRPKLEAIAECDESLERD
eukprot:CAMPEP_0184697056 /NCGR_PEP_ID=MMETSP0313-20130426/4160_1 /TAXON_ID=2792 /ORGANISM="Porphyridium aerugineum, Strain SAG 1380-2" /LENGTH=74 /DNA_ID=CAMNT_0027155817 /DNA_START=135 /DNA_END=359 /DNA_ORIENTATION=-